MLRFLTDENFNKNITRAILRVMPDLDLVLVEKVGLRAVPDGVVLEWAANEYRVVLPHDLKTLVPLAHKRIADGLLMPGVVLVRWDAKVGRAIEDLLLFIGANRPEDIVNNVVYGPFA